MSEPLVLSYLTSSYARASDSFVRNEVRTLRELGHTVHTFSIRRPPQHEVVGEEVDAEFRRTHYILDAGAKRLLRAVLRRVRHDALGFGRAALLAGRIGQPGVRGRAWPFAYLVEATYLAEQLAPLRVQHLHVHIAEGAASVAMLASQLSGVPFSVTVHGPGELDRAASLGLERKLARSSFFVAISDFARGQLLRWTRPEDWSKVHVVRCGVDRGFLEREPASLPAQARVVSVGRLDVEKGQIFLLEAISQLVADGIDARLVLVGDGPLRAALEDAARRLEVADRVEFTGWLPAAEVIRTIEDSRGLVMASLAEGLPVVVMEALALRRPVIATSVAALSELVEPDVSGWLVPPGSVVELTKAMRTLLGASEEELGRMGSAGALRVRERHDMVREVRKLEALFHHGAEGDAAT